MVRPKFALVAVVKDLTAQIGAAYAAEKHHVKPLGYFLAKGFQLRHKLRRIGMVFGYIRKTGKIDRLRNSILER